MTTSNEKAAGGGAVLEAVAWIESAAMSELWLGYRKAAYGLDFGKHDLVTKAAAESALKLQADRIADLEKDAARLDWIESRVCDVSRLGDSARTIRISWNNGADHVDVGPHTCANWRAAIDAALSKTTATRAGADKDAS